MKKKATKSRDRKAFYSSLLSELVFVVFSFGFKPHLPKCPGIDLPYGFRCSLDDSRNIPERCAHATMRPHYEQFTRTKDRH